MWVFGGIWLVNESVGRASLTRMYTYTCTYTWKQGGGDPLEESEAGTGAGGFGFARGGRGADLFSRDGLFKLAGYAAVAYVGALWWWLVVGCVCVCVCLGLGVGVADQPIPPC